MEREERRIRREKAKEQRRLEEEAAAAERKRLKRAARKALAASLNLTYMDFPGSETHALPLAHVISTSPEAQARAASARELHSSQTGMSLPDDEDTAVVHFTVLYRFLILFNHIFVAASVGWIDS